MSVFCSVALVLALDVSASMSDSSWHLQRDGLADAFLDARIQEMVLNQPGGAAVAVVQWAASATVTVPWIHINGPIAIDRLVSSIREQPRSQSVGFDTSIGTAIQMGMDLMDTVPCTPGRRVIDISGDGHSNLGIDPAIMRDQAEDREIIINGLPILATEPDVDTHYRERVITSDGFVEVAQGFEDFSRAIRRKLSLEIAEAVPGTHDKR